MIYPLAITVGVFAVAAYVELHASRRRYRRPNLMYYLASFNYWWPATLVSTASWLIWVIVQ